MEVEQPGRVADYAEAAVTAEVRVGGAVGFAGEAEASAGNGMPAASACGGARGSAGLQQVEAE
ncbi:hypothetical protein JOD54_006021 [Actinokineospora baliensis]|uniref:hypothetical protein n=1 Tax=Actinokineospora baliensis TaxID=547056 RepID=UPI00195C5784|nr:hypothetical protein [Actinokineospora baliensis]MBM7775817.1 hypothetical protein [Actinokineospora baliensis]